MFYNGSCNDRKTQGTQTYPTLITIPEVEEPNTPTECVKKPSIHCNLNLLKEVCIIVNIYADSINYFCKYLNLNSGLELFVDKFYMDYSKFTHFYLNLKSYCLNYHLNFLEKNLLDLFYHANF